MTTLGLKGAELDTVMQGHTWDEPQFLPLFKAAEALGAVLFFHPQPQDNLLLARTDKYGLANSIGVIVEDALAVAALIFGGFSTPARRSRPALPTGVGRPALAWVAWTGAGRCAPRRLHIQKPPSTYQRRLYYDCITSSEAALRFLIDQVGVDRVVLGSDWPFVQWEPSPVAWVQDSRA